MDWSIKKLAQITSELNSVKQYVGVSREKVATLTARLRHQLEVFDPPNLQPS